MLDVHALRTTFCTELGQSGASVETVRELARHASITTTARYRRTDESQRQAAIAALPAVEPLAQVAVKTGTDDSSVSSDGGSELTALLTGTGRETPGRDGSLRVEAEAVDDAADAGDADENPATNGVWRSSGEKEKRWGWDSNPRRGKAPRRFSKPVP